MTLAAAADMPRLIRRAIKPLGDPLLSNLVGLRLTVVARAAAFRFRGSASSTTVKGLRAATLSSAPPSTTTGRRATRSWLSGGLSTGGSSNASRSVPPTVRSTIERSSKLACVADHHPSAPASQQRSCSVVKNRTTSVPSLIMRYTCGRDCLEPGSAAFI